MTLLLKDLDVPLSSAPRVKVRFQVGLATWAPSPTKGFLNPPRPPDEQELCGLLGSRETYVSWENPCEGQKRVWFEFYFCQSSLVPWAHLLTTPSLSC